ncbi:MAG: GNAT family N-acetyltransferase [Promethearchaeota archaeon]
MENIVFRHYSEGDDKQLAKLFNLTFNRDGIGPIRTLKSWVWRYIRSPGFEPEMCQIAEDIEKKLIVGAVYANLIEFISLNGKNYLVGDINDVSCHPDYSRRGIATKLMHMAIKYMKKKRCDFSILSAGYKGFPRIKIYKRLGFIDLERGISFIQIPNMYSLIKDIYGFISLFPLLFTFSYLPRIIQKMRIKFNPFLREFSFEINYNRRHFEYMRLMNQILPKYYTGYRKYNKEKYIWERINVPSKNYKPTYIVIKKNKKIIGGATITQRNFHSFKYKIKLKIGIIQEIFLDKSVFKDKHEIQLGYLYLIDKILKAATRRFLSVLLYNSALKDYDLHLGFKAFHFLKLHDQVLMIKVLKKNLKIPHFKKPFFIPLSVSLGG